ncbi:MAG: SufS family cysteine desulfurase [Planctomycetota bacterium]|nr:SufS family cysteine desulfurase [Planctomycetota bacterium]
MKTPDSSNRPQSDGGPLDVQAIRAQFPILQSKVHGKPLIYFDNAATTQKPLAVIEAIDSYYRTENANIHRGVHTLSQQATADYEKAREKITRFINAAETREIIFTRGTTEGINLVASSWGRQFLRAGDEILLSSMEHHSNIVPWQMIAEQTGAKIRVIPMNDRGELLMDEFDRLLSDRTKMVAVVHTSNSLGTINPVKEIITKAHVRGAVVLIDGAQWVAHGPTDVRALDADFYAFSGHKLYGPTGIGVLYGKAKLLEAIPPYQGGGDMISSVTFEKTTYNVLPHKFEAGTPHIAGGIGLGAAIDWITSLGLERIAKYEHALAQHATERLSAIPGLRLIGTAREKANVFSFIIESPPLSSMDIGAQLDAQGIAVRTGHHCCQPVMDRMKISSTARASMAVYNAREEIDVMADELARIIASAAAKKPTAKPAQGIPIIFPAATAASPQAVADELIETFEFLGDWEQRHQFLVELGDKLLPMSPMMKSESNRVHGCMSTVHLAAQRRPGTADTLEFLADSDAAIVRGLIALLERVFSGQSASAILGFDIEGFLKRLGLDQHLSMGRRNGLAGMIQRIRAEAASLAKLQGAPAPA